MLKSLGLNPIDGADFTLGSVDFLFADYLKQDKLRKINFEIIGFESN